MLIPKAIVAITILNVDGIVKCSIIFFFAELCMLRVNMSITLYLT